MFKTLLMLAASALLCQGQTPIRIPWIPAAKVLEGRLSPVLAALPPLELKPEKPGPGKVALRLGADADQPHRIRYRKLIHG